MSLEQTDLFTTPADTPARAARFPEGFAYREDVITPAEEAELVEEFQHLTFVPFEFRGFLGKRNVASFGWKYDYGRRRIEAAPPIPAFLRALQDRIASMRPDASGEFDQALVAQYETGTAIGWHRDRPMYDDVVGISLLSPCRFRLRRKHGDKWQRMSFDALPRSAYRLSGASRWEWEHSIPPVPALRYSITFRRLSGSQQKTSP